MKVTYLCHSGFLVELKNSILIFDCYKGRLPAVSKKKTLYVFVSHGHGDHYNPEIFKWAKEFPKIRFILSDDIDARYQTAVSYVGPDAKLDIDGLSVQTLRSTDEGVAFLVRAEGRVIYHAGDLNWWHWSGESDTYNQTMAQDYKREIAKLADEEIDLAFLPLDPRQGADYLLGFDYFMRHTHTKKAVPMHMWDKYEIIGDLIKDPVSRPYRDRILVIKKEGQNFDITE